VGNTDVSFFSVRAVPEGGKVATVDLTEKILEFQFDDEESKADRLLLKVSNEDLSEFDNPIWRKGVILEATWGYPDRVASTRRCVIRKIGGARQLTVEAHALSMLLHTEKKSRVWKNMTPSDIAKKIQADYAEILGIERSLDPSANTCIVSDDEALRLERRVQAAETDATFLMRMAKKHGKVFYVDGQGVHFKPRNLKQAPVKTLTWYGGDGPDAEFIDFTVDNDITARPGSVTKKGFDPLAKKAISHRADNDSTTRDGLAPVIEIVDGRTGEKHLAKRASEDHVEHTNEVTAGAAKSHAAGKFREVQHVTVKLSVKAIGDPDLLAKRVVNLQGLGKRLSGRYYIKSATHKIGSGYTVELHCKTDGHGGYPTNNAKSNATPNVATERAKIKLVDGRTGQTRIAYRKDGEEGI
jgi:phage protein D